MLATYHFDFFLAKGKLFSYIMTVGKLKVIV